MVHLAQVFQALTEAHLKVKIVVLQAHKVEFLGHQISANDIEPNTKNIEAVVTFPTPKKVKVIRSFIRPALIAGDISKISARSLNHYTSCSRRM